MLVKTDPIATGTAERAAARAQGSAPRARRASLGAHQRVIVVGVCLLASCAAIAGIGLWGVATVHAAHVRLGRQEVPALALLLQIDRDLYQAELALERARSAHGDAELHAQQDTYAENVAQSEARFADFKRLAVGQPGESTVIAAYESARNEWIAASGARVDRLHHGPIAAGAPAGPRNGTAPAFEAMRSNLNVLVDTIYEPAIERSAQLSDRQADRTGWVLAVGIGGALLAGVVLTRSTARALYRQHAAAARVAAQLADDHGRQEFESKLGRGLEMSQDEPATLLLIEDVIRVLAPGLAAEVLLADSSRAHLHRAASTHPDRLGCGVGKPCDCPAVRRGHALSFATGDAFDACPRLRGRAGGDRSAVCIPLSVMGKSVGVLHATAAPGQLPDAAQLNALELIASKAGERIGMLRAFRRTEAQAASDPLTGLMNRRSLEEKVHELRRQGTRYAVAYGDLDHFKSLNDTHGHETGDKALRKFAQVLKATVRPSDLPARWGGEEFVLVLPNASAAEAMVALDRVRAALADALRGAGTPAFTASFGVAENAPGCLFADALARADEALLAAKRAGRDRVVMSDAVPTCNSPSAVTEELSDDDVQPIAA